MKNLDRIIEKLENLGFEYQSWENDNKTIQNIILEEKENFLYPSFFNFEYFGNIQQEDKPKKILYFSKSIFFHEDSEFDSYEEYLNFLDNIKGIVQEIEKNSISCILMENSNLDFHFIGFLFPAN